MSNADSHHYIDRWFNSQTKLRSQIVDNEDEYCSNLYAFDLPESVFIYKREDVEEVLTKRHIPMKKNKKVIVTFACNKCVSDWCLREVDFIKLDVYKRQVHDMDLIRSNAHTDQLSYLRSLCRVNDPIISSLTNMHFKVHTFKNDVLDNSRQLPLNGRHNTNILRPHNHLNKFLGAEALIHAGEFIARKFHTEIAQHHTCLLYTSRCV